MRKLFAFVLMAALLTATSICPALAFSETSVAPAAAVTQADGTATEVIKAPTCVEAGTAAVYDVATGTILRMILLPATGEHNYAAEVLEPTCESAGGTRYTCTMCGDSYMADYVAPLGHNYVYQYDAVRNADGSFASFGTLKCEHCGDVLEANEALAAYYYSLQEGTAAEAPAPAVEAPAVDAAAEAPAEEKPKRGRAKKSSVVVAADDDFEEFSIDEINE